jgi:threonine dehydratase
MIPKEWFSAAKERLSPHIIHTPIMYDGTNHLFTKWESYQITGSFKARGAINKILALQDWEQQQGLVTASAGNHGLGVAYAGNLIQAKVTVFVPEHASPLKIEKIMGYGANIIKVPGEYPDAERAGKLFAAARGQTWVSAYNDGLVIAGQGTIAFEVIADLPQLEDAAWVIPVGGGGLIAGIITALLSTNRTPDIYGVQAANSPFFHALLKYGSQADIVDKPTLADGLSGEIETTSVTIPIVRKHVKDIVLVSEDEILMAIDYAWATYGEPIEPSGAVTLAAVLSGKIHHKPVVAIISGGNIAADHHTRLVQQSRLMG